MLHYQTYDGPDAVPLLIVHGLYGSARNMGVIAKRLSVDRPVHVVDQRNHGQSPWFDSHTYHDMASDLAQVVADIGGPVDVMGHSMGGKAAMVLALTQPKLLRRLIVADIAPVPYAHDQIQYVEAMKALDLSNLDARSEADRRLAAFVPEPGVRAFLLQSLDLKSEVPRWRLNLDVLARDMDHIVGFPADAADVYHGPALFLSGANSHYVLPEHRPLIKSMFSNTYFAKLRDAGHWLHADKPREFEAAIRHFTA